MGIIVGTDVAVVVVELVVFHQLHRDDVYPIMLVAGVLAIVLSLLGFVIISRDARHNNK